MTKKQIEICYSNSMKINKGQYEQEAPFYSAKTIIEENGQPIDEVAEYNRLRGIIDPLLLAQYQDAKVGMSGARVRIKDGKKYPSVTSILNPDSPPIDPEYGLRGTEIHRMFKEWVFGGIWPDPGIKLEKLKFEDVKYEEFFKKFESRIDFNNARLDVEVFHEKHLYSGEIDVICPVDDLLTICDLKTGGWDWQQLVAYYKAKPEGIKQLAVFDLKNQELDILQLTDKKCPEYWEKFLIKRGAFQARFSL